MTTAALPLHEGLVAGSRIHGLPTDRRRHLLEVALLIACGATAAVASAYLEMGLRIPGHAILRVIFPMALGLAMVPRRRAGTLMGGSALVTGLALRALVPGTLMSLGALTSLTLTGPLLDLSLRRARAGWRLYAGFAIAGLVANLLAFAVRGGAKLFALEHVGARPLVTWLGTASVSYVVCGLLAGLLSAAIWFRAHGREAAPRQ